MTNPLCPDRKEADRLLTWAGTQNPGLWVDHCRVVARVAETVARWCGMDGDRAYALGLLHDIGRYEGVSDLHHVIAGYALLCENGYRDAARICLTHSFSYPDLRAYLGKQDCSEEELAFLRTFLETAEYDDEDRLIQLGDALGSAHGVVLLDIRLLDVIRRHGFAELGQKKIETVFAIKAHFDRLAGLNIYTLFSDEIQTNCFG
jgi:putative nucleotidyltransferase with HDIG domain